MPLFSRFQHRDRKVSLRWKLVLPFLLQLAGTVAIIGYFSFQSGQQAVEDLAYHLLEESRVLTTNHLYEFFMRPDQIGQINATLLEQGHLQVDDFTGLKQFWLEQFKVSPRISGIAIATEQQTFLAVERSDSDHLFVRRLDQSTNRQFHRYQIDWQGNELQLLETRKNFNPHNDPPGNPWYQATRHANQPIWRFVVSLVLGEQNPILSLIRFVPLLDATNRFQGVLAVNIHLTQLNEFLKTLTVGKTGQVFIIDRQGYLIASSTGEAPFISKVYNDLEQTLNPEQQRLSIFESRSPQTRKIANALRDRWQEYQSFSNQNLTLEIGQNRHFLNIYSFQSIPELDWLIITVIPESDFITEIQANVYKTFFVWVATLTITLLMGKKIVSRVILAIEKLSNSAKEISQGNIQLCGSNNTGIEEIDVLSQAFEEMVRQVQSTLDASEQRYAKIFHNSPDSISISSLESERFIEVNHRFLELTGYTCSEVLGHTAQELNLLNDQEVAIRMREELRTKRKLKNFELQWRNKAGEIKFSLLSAEIFNSDGKTFVLCITKDVTLLKQTESALWRSQQLLNRLTDALPVLISYFDSEQRYQFVNQTHEQFFQRKRETIIGKTLAEVVGENNYQLIQGYIERVLTGQLTTYTLQQVDEQGNPLWLDVTLIPDFNEQEEVKGCYSLIIDITARKQTEETLLDSERRFRLAVNHAPDAFVIYDRDLRYQYVNERTQELCQLTLEEFLGQRNEELFSEEFYRVFLPLVEKARDTKTLQSRECLFHFPNHPPYTMLVKYVPLLDEDGEVQQIFGMTMDITELKQTQKVLQDREAMLRMIGDHLPNGAIYQYCHYLEGQKYLRYISAGIEETSGYTAEELLENVDLLYQQYLDEDRKKLDIAFQESLQNLSVIDLQIRKRDRMGKTRWVHVRAAPYYLEEGCLLWNGLELDITELKQSELDLKKAKETAESANLAKTMFLANMSHELRTPLNAILGFTQVLMRRTDTNEEQRSLLQIIFRSGNHLLSLINDILDVSKIEVGQVALEESNFNLVDLLKWIENLLKLRAESKGLKLELEMANNLPQIIVADYKKLRQVLINLISNAIKFTQQGYVKLRVSLETDTGLFLRFSIEDTGVGIEPEAIEQIFEAFTQASSSKFSSEGTGLGLTISRKLVELMGGTLNVRSVLTQGSTFWFTLPINLDYGGEVQPLDFTHQVIGLVSGSPSYKILIVDPQLENRQFIYQQLSVLGFLVQETPKIEETVRIWQEWQPNLIFIAVQRPEIFRPEILSTGYTTGYDVTRQIRSRERANQEKSCQIIAIAESCFESDRNSALGAGCTDFLIQPITRIQVLEVISRYLGVKYVYEEKIDDLSHPQATEAVYVKRLKPNDLGIMSLEWVQALERSAKRCDDVQIEKLLQEIPSNNHKLFDDLYQLVHNFQFRQILELTIAFLDSSKSDDMDS